jgi:kynurenine formamidase
VTAPTEDEVLAYFDTLSNWGRWGDDDSLGTLNLVTPEKRIAAAQLVRVGETVSCAWDIGGPGALNTPAVQRFMLATGELSMSDFRALVASSGGDPDRLAPGRRDDDRSSGAGDFLGVAYHGYTVTHIDGLSHVFWDGRMYGGHTSALVTASFGAMRHGIQSLSGGVVTRGVLLDIARLRGVDWLEPGESVSPSDLEACEAEHGLRVDEGDVLLLRTGYGRKVREKGRDDVGTVGRAGWHASVLPWFHERGVAAIACDTAQDAMPSGYGTVRSPIHSVGIAAMGLWLIDNCDLEPLSAACDRLGKWEFLFTVAPLRWVGATGSPANPLATF